MNRLRIATVISMCAAIAGGQTPIKRNDPAAPTPKRQEGTEGFDDAGARARWMLERMGGAIPPGFSHRALREALRARESFPTQFRAGAGGPERGLAMPSTATNPTWVALGPTDAQFTQNGSVTLNKIDSGRLRTILVHPTDSNTVLVLTSGGGLWRTSDFGSTYPTWVPLSDFVGSTSGGAVAFGRSTNLLYLGLGDPFDHSDTDGVWSVGGAVVRSIDGGQTWSAPVSFSDNTGTVQDLAVDTSQAQDILLIATNKGLYRSTDGGQTVSLVGSIPATHTVWSIVRTSIGWLATTREMNSSSSNYLFGFLYVTTDHGATWTQSADPLMSADPFGRMTLAVAQGGDATVYGFAADKTGGATYDLYVSQNGGTTWTKKNLVPKVPINPTGDQTNMDLMHFQAFYNHMILIDPTDVSRNTVYLGGNLCSAKSTDGGATWRLTSHWLPGGPSGSGSIPYAHADFHCAAFQTAGAANRVLFGNDGGLFVSSDGGTTWDDRKNRGLNSALVYSLAVNPNVPGSAMIGLQDNGVRVRQSLTGTFNAVNGGDGMGVGWAQGSGVSLGSYVYNQISRTTTNPPADISNYSAFTSGLGSTGSSDNGTSYYFVTPVYTPPSAADPTGQVFFTYSNGGTGPNSKSIFKSSSSSWSVIGKAGVSPGLSSTSFVRSVPHALGVSPLDINRVAAAGNSGNILITTNGGSSWSEVSLGSSVPGWNNFNAGVVWANNNVLYAHSEALTAGSVRVARSGTGGTAWSPAGSGLPDVPVTRLAIDPTDATGNTVFAGTWIGMYWTTNGGTSWTPYGQGLPQVRITDIFVAPDGSFIRVGTYGRGVWEAQLSSGGGGETTTQLLLNPGFESGNTVWTVSNPDIINPSSVSGMQVHSGTWGAWISGYGTVHTDTMSQDVVLPANASHVELNFWLKIATAESGGIANDTFKVQIRNTSGGVLGTLLSLSNLDAPAYASFIKKTYDITQYKGQTIRVYLEGVENASLGTSFWVDDFELNSTTSTATAPSITQHPQGLTINAGQTAVFNVTATGTAPLAYQWRKGGSNIGGATAATYTINNAQTSDAGSFDVVVSNTAGSVTSNAAVLTVNAGSTAPSITGQPGSQTVTAGQSVSFTVTATGSAPLSYQWRRNGSNITGATSATFTFTATYSNNGDQYSVVVSNGAGSATSNNAALTVNVKNRDLSGDGMTNVLDLATFMAAYSGSGIPTSNPAADLDGDGDCDDADLALLLAAI